MEYVEGRSLQSLLQQRGRLPPEVAVGYAVQAANGLHRDALRSQAFTIASFLRPQPDGGITLDIPPEVRPLYSGEYGLYAYAVLDAEGRVLFSSRNDGGALFAHAACRMSLRPSNRPAAWGPRRHLPPL